METTDVKLVGLFVLRSPIINICYLKGARFKGFAPLFSNHYVVLYQSSYLLGIGSQY